MSLMPQRNVMVHLGMYSGFPYDAAHALSRPVYSAGRADRPLRVLLQR